jgi:hypothetical protein
LVPFVPSRGARVVKLRRAAREADSLSMLDIFLRSETCGQLRLEVTQHLAARRIVSPFYVFLFRVHFQEAAAEW